MIIEKENAISKTVLKELQDKILDNNFPWYYQSYSSSEKFPFFSHMLLPRYDYHNENQPEPQSNLFYKFKDILDSFCQINNIEYNRILRACINMTTNYSQNHSDFHVDHDFSHKVIIMYLNDVDNNATLLKNTNNLIKRYDSKAGKILCFNGEYEHAAEFCNEGQRRIVCVFTIDEKKDISTTQIKAFQYLQQKAEGIEHSGDTFINHCIGTYNELVKMQTPLHVQLAGLFHSFYGTETFKSNIQINRDELKSIIGEKSENLVFEFCNQKNKEEFYLKNYKTHKDLAFISLANLIDTSKRYKDSNLVDLIKSYTNKLISI